jgi:rSAM/selenodomain-associated transferase 2
MISIIVPVLNEENSIEETLKKLKGEIIVVDGGSTDRTVEISRKYAKIITSEKGRGKQMNQGVKHSEGDVLLFLHADTKLPKNWEDEINESMEEDFVGGVFKHSFKEKHWLLKFGSFCVNLNFSYFSFGDRGVFIRRDIFFKLKGYKNIPIMEDIDFVKRMKKIGKIKYLESEVKTSARRFLEIGIFKQLMLDFLLLSLYFLKFDVFKLSKLYKVVR